MSVLWRISVAFSIVLGALVHRTFVGIEPAPGEWHIWNNGSTEIEPVEDFPANLIFDSVNSLLQHWPNRRYRNGHTIVPATIPVGTLLYHGSYRQVIPPGPEWVAMDPEHAFMFCTNLNKDGCWYLTLTTTRPLNLLYFDGSSGAKMKGGPLDSQDTLLWGGPVTDTINLENQRICELCTWGKPLGLDGFIRMEMDFEVMLCDFTAGLEVLSFDNLFTSGFPAPEEPTPPNPCDALPVPAPVPKLEYAEEPPATEVSSDSGYIVMLRAMQTEFSTIEAGTWHSDYPGDSRIQLDLARALTFYDPYLFPSLSSLRRGKDRWSHRLLGVDNTEVLHLRSHLTEILLRKEMGSGIDWRALFNVVIDRYAGRLELLRHLLDSGADSTQVGKNVHNQLRAMVAPYRFHNLKPPGHHESGNHTWASPVIKRCATSHTSFISSLATLTRSERLLLRSLQAVSTEICRVIVQVWAEGMEHGLGLDVPRYNSPEDASESLVIPDYVVQEWSREINALMKWLDWSIWVRCDPACSIEEMCYLPTWPFLGAATEEDMDQNAWNKHHPRCIGRLPPYDGLKMW